MGKLFGTVAGKFPLDLVVDNTPLGEHKFAHGTGLFGFQNVGPSGQCVVLFVFDHDVTHEVKAFETDTPQNFEDVADECGVDTRNR